MRALAAVGAALLVGFSLPANVRADIGPRWWGDRAAEPLGLKGVDITHQDLTIDLRPLAAVQPVHVEAVYSLHNPAAARKLDLVFVSGVKGVTDFQVRLGDRLLESRPVLRKHMGGHGEEMPKSWQPPPPRLGIDGEAYFMGEPISTELELLEFSVELPPGPSTLSARYRARAWGAAEYLPDHGRPVELYPTVTWQFPYVLAPAREWKSFGGLDVTVYLPEGWQSASAPKLHREGAVLHGHFSDVPADTLMLAARAPVGPELRRATYLYLGLDALLVVAGGVLCWLGGRILGHFRTKYPDRPDVRDLSVAGPALLALLWGAAILVVQDFAWRGILGSLAGQESPYFYREDVIGFGCLACPQLLVALPVGFLTARRGVRAYFFASSAVGTTHRSRPPLPPGRSEAK
jgi:hypothetical protein